MELFHCNVGVFGYIKRVIEWVCYVIFNFIWRRFSEGMFSSEKSGPQRRLPVW